MARELLTGDDLGAALTAAKLLKLDHAEQRIRERIASERGRLALEAPADEAGRLSVERGPGRVSLVKPN